MWKGWIKMKWIKERQPWRAELISDCVLESDGKIVVSASKENPVPGTVTSHCTKRIGRNRVLMYCFHPDVEPDKTWEFSSKCLKRIKSQ